MTSSPHQVTVFRVFGDLLRHRRLVATSVLLSAAGAGVLASARSRTYTSVASFVAEWGTTVPGNGVMRADLPLDPRYYGTLLQSRTLLTAAAASRYVISTPAGRRQGTVADMYELAGQNEDARLDAASRRLWSDIEVTYRTTGVVVMQVRTFHPELSQQIARRLLELLGEHNRKISSARTDAQVTFLTRERARAQAEVRTSEDRLVQFLSGNRFFVESSPLALTLHRLQAEVREKRAVYASLTEQIERARLQGDRGAPTLSILEEPELPPRPDGRGVIQAIVAGGIGGAALATLLVLVASYVGRLRSFGSDELSELGRRWRAVRPWGRRRDVDSWTSAAQQLSHTGMEHG
jgi:uncharacterized protein involved in exopolysaccharide biosynthesis